MFYRAIWKQGAHQPGAAGERGLPQIEAAGAAAAAAAAETARQQDLLDLQSGGSDDDDGGGDRLQLSDSDSDGITDI